MRVGILTFHAVDNFGAVLQTYALCQTLKSLKCEPCVIDYHQEFLARNSKRLGYRPLTIARNALRKWRYRRFRKMFIPTTDRIYRSREELLANPPDVDVCVCGSDQIWNVGLLGGRLDTSFFLDFVPEGVRRVAYAPSMGGDVFPDVLHGEIARLLNGFDAIAVREKELCAIIKQMTGRDAPVVLDPSLLIEDYSAVIRKPRRSPGQCIVVYPMEYSRPFEEFVKKVQTLLKLPVVNIGKRSLSIADFNLNCLGPREWLGWMQTASFVCTNSFHGTAYAIIFKRNCAVFPHQKIPPQNARMKNLLEQVGLTDRFVANLSQLNNDSRCFQSIDYGAVVQLLQVAVLKSRNYLKDAIFGPAPSNSGHLSPHWAEHK